MELVLHGLLGVGFGLASDGWWGEASTSWWQRWTECYAALRDR